MFTKEERVQFIADVQNGLGPLIKPSVKDELLVRCLYAFQGVDVAEPKKRKYTKRVKGVTDVEGQLNA